MALEVVGDAIVVQQRVVDVDQKDDSAALRHPFGTVLTIAAFMFALFGAVPSVDFLGQAIRFRRAPGARLILISGSNVAEDRLHDRPRRFDRVLAREQHPVHVSNSPCAKYLGYRD